MKTHTISDTNVPMLRDIQVSFVLQGGLVVIVQVEIHSQFTGFYEMADLSRFSPSALQRLERICADWFNGHCFPQELEFNNDDNEIA